MPSFYRIDGEVQTPLGSAVEGASVAILTQPADVTTQPGSPLAVLYAASSSNAATVTAASWTGQVINFTLNTVPSDLVAGSYIAVSGVAPSGYNSTTQFPWLVTEVNGLVVSVAALTNPGTYVSGGTVATSALPNPTASDGNGHYFAYAASGIYTLQVYGPTIVEQDYPDQVIGFNNSGSVTSVGLTMPAEFSVSGSPVTMSGTIAVTKANESANLVYAGPSSGSPAAPTFRTLVSADIPSMGGVTSVGLTATVPAILTQSVSGSPVTSSGTLGLTIGLANETANTVFAGPTGGGAAPPTFRSLVAADVATAFVPVSQFTQNNLSSNVVLTGSVLATVSTLNLTMPASGGPFRILVAYSLYVTNTGGLHTDLNVFVTDGTHLFAGTEINEPASGPSASGVACSAFSPTTYANGASVTLTLKAECDQTTLSIMAAPTNAGPNSFFQSTVMASN